MKIAVIGTGYVGLVTGACFAETGNDVTCADKDTGKIGRLSRGEIPFYEPGLAELVARNVAEGRLRFTSKTADAVSKADISFICVGTPSNSDGSANLDAVMAAAREIAEASRGAALIAVKSTVPVGTAEKIKAEMEAYGEKIRIVSNPEFLREGAAVQDCLRPDRIVIGTDDEAAADIFRELYQPFVRTGNPVFVFDSNSAEMTKYTANALLAARISFMNEISMLCEKAGADVSLVRAAVGADHRIGTQYLFPSLGFGGSCFPKDIRALQFLAEKNGLKPRMLRATLDANDAQKERFTQRILAHFGGAADAKGKKAAVWGLAFKAKTDDIRESAALSVVDGLLGAGMNLTVYDPAAMPNAEAVYGGKLKYAQFPYDALEGAEVLCVLTEWNQFRHPDFPRMKELLKAPVIFDGRNLYDPDALAKAGFTYHSIGR